MDLFSALSDHERLICPDGHLPCPRRHYAHEGAARKPHGAIALSALIFTGVGWVLVGIYPADINENMHVLGALIIFVVGNVALVFASGMPAMSTLGQASSIILGLIAFAAAFLHFGGTYLGLGMGGMERVTAYPVSIWTMIVALLLLAGHRRWR